LNFFSRILLFYYFIILFYSFLFLFNLLLYSFLFFLHSTHKTKIDAVIITTPDRLHLEPAIAFANKGYHLLLEKPMAVSEEDCISIAQAVHKNNVILGVGHVLRYTPYTQKIKELIPELGELLNVNHIEPVGYYHFAHSYVVSFFHHFFSIQQKKKKTL